MKQFLIILILISSYSLKGQDLDFFTVGMEYFNRGEYYEADSMLNLHLNKFPNDGNAKFNKCLIKIFIGDTCGFCNQIIHICHGYNDREACNLFYKICGKSDTIYYDKNKIECNKEKARYKEITETNMCKNYNTVYVHDKKKKGKTIHLNYSDITNSQKSDLIAIYHLYDNDKKIFVYSLIGPKRRGGDEARSDYMTDNVHIKKAKEELNLNKFVANLEYIVDKTGSINSVRLVSTSYDVENLEKLKEYINLIVSEMPRYIPAQFENENVDYIVKDFISFW